MSTIIESVRHRIFDIAQEYRNKEYEVIEFPSREHLPAFLSGHRPDLIAIGNDETVIVEVKTRSTLATDSQIGELSQLVRSKPGWRFELILVSEQEKLETPENAKSLDRTAIQERIQEAEKLVEHGSNEAALILLWSAIEALVRMLTDEEGLTLERVQPSYILKVAVSNGVISRDDYKFLSDALKYRNALVHGFNTPDLTPELVESLVAKTNHLLEETNV